MSPSHDGRSAETIRAAQNPVQKYVMGDLKILSDWLSDKPWVISLPLWILRAMGAPIFLNNPISGALILIGMFIDNPWLAISSILGCCVAICTSMLIRMDRRAIESGGCTFHGMLVGIAIAASVDKGNYYPYVIVPVIVMSVIRSGHHFWKIGLPAFNLPFIVALFMFLSASQYTSSLNPTVANPWFPIKSGDRVLRNESLGYTELDWAKMFRAIPLSCAQIYGSVNLITGFLVLLGMLVCSPIICLHALLGPILSIFTALAVAAPPKQIYDGIWSFNAMLTCCSLGGFFFVLTIQSHVIALLAAVFATIVHGALSTAFLPAGVPVVALPFVLSTSIFLSVSTESKYIRRVPMDDITYPELHRQVYNPNHVADDRVISVT